MFKKTIFLMFLFCSLEVFSQSQLVVTSSGEVDLGSFVKGGSYSVTPCFNEITYTITAFDSVDCEHTVILYNSDSEFGSESDVKIITEWTVDINTPFVNGGEYRFKKFLKVKVKVLDLHISPNAISGKRREFAPRLVVEEIKY